jgi:hypothetical protein
MREGGLGVREMACAWNESSKWEAVWVLPTCRNHVRGNVDAASNGYVGTVELGGVSVYLKDRCIIR